MKPSTRAAVSAGIGATVGVVIVVLTILAVSGCTVSGWWLKPGASEYEAQADLKDCEYTALLATAGGGGSRYDVTASVVAKNEIVRACMGRKGYTL